MKEEQMQIEFINQEIAAENADETPNDKSLTEEDGKSVSRKSFRLNDFDVQRDKEMAVFTHAKKLSEYIFVITEKSPKKLRWSIVSRLQNCSVDIIENLYQANYERGEERVKWQKKAMVCINLLDFYTETAKTKQAINIRQMGIIAKQLSDVKRMLYGWIKSDKRKG